MNLNFDFSQVRAIEFGVGLDDTDGRNFYCIPVDQDVQAALRDMAEATWDSMRSIDENPKEFDPSNKYGHIDYVYLPIGKRMAKRMRELHKAQNIPIDSTAISNPLKLFCYFARMIDRQGLRLTAVRRGTQFKGIIKSRLIRLVTDALRIVKDDIFKLDNDFDLLVDSVKVHILRPSGFEFVCQLQADILAAVTDNVNAIQPDLPFIDFTNIHAYAKMHPRAARYLASIRTQVIQNIDQRALRQLCNRTGVEIRTINRKIVVDDENMMGFLEVLDRRRYGVDLVTNSPERYRAASRERLDS